MYLPNTPFTSPTSIVNDSGGGSTPWSIFSITNSYCLVDKTTSNYLNFSSYGFSIPNHPIGIEVQVSGSASLSGSTLTAQLMDAGTRVGSSQTVSPFGYATLGGASDLWGTVWNLGQIAASGFGVSIYGVGDQNGTDLYCYGVAVKIYYNDVPTGSGSIQLSGFSCGGYIETACSGDLNSSLNGLNLTTYGLTADNNYGFINNYVLYSMDTDIAATTTLTSSGGPMPLNRLNTSIYGGTTNFGALDGLQKFDPIGLASSGIGYNTNSGFSYATLNSVSASSSTDIPKYGKFSTEWRKFSGRACIDLRQDSKYNTFKVSGSCSLLSPDPISVYYSGNVPYPDSKTKEVFYSCACTKQLRIYLTRPHIYDISFNYEIAEPASSGSINYSGHSYRPAVGGVEFIESTGTVVIPSGSSYADYNIQLLDADLADHCYFRGRITKLNTNKLCEYPSNYIDIYIKPTGI